MIRSERQRENSREKMNRASEVCGATSVVVESRKERREWAGKSIQRYG